MHTPSSILDYVEQLKERAAVLRREHAPYHADQLETVANELRAVHAADADTLLTPEEVVNYSRGYNRRYLMDNLTNYGTTKNPLYRKEDIPRKIAA